MTYNPFYSIPLDPDGVPYAMDFEDFENGTDRTWALTGRESLLNAGLGVGGEGGEVCDLIKKELFHGKDIPKLDYIHEVGDVLFYLARIAREKGFSLEDAAIANYRTLLKRRPDGHLPQ